LTIPQFELVPYEPAGQSISYISDCEIECSDAEQEWPIGSPAMGWAEAERTAPGNSRVNAGKNRQSQYYYRQKAKKIEDEKAQLVKQHKTLDLFFRYKRDIAIASAPTTGAPANPESQQPAH